MLFDSLPGRQNLDQFSIEQMQSRSKVLALAADLLRSHPEQLPESEAVASELMEESRRWIERIERRTAVLTAAQTRAYKNLKKFIAENGKSPTIKELGMMDGLSASAVRPHLTKLIKKGYLSKEEGVQRGFAIIKEI